MRDGRVSRETRETDISVEVCLDGGSSSIECPSGFFGHMLDALARHGRLGLKVQARGDTEVDLHHTVEDTGIVLGQALLAALGDKNGIERYGLAKVPMDEALVEVSLDLSGRPFFALEAGEVFQGKVGEFDLELVPEFFRALAFNAGITLHMKVCAGSNGHHLAEAGFKAFARALAQAVALTGEGIPSTKDML